MKSSTQTPENLFVYLFICLFVISISDKLFCMCYDAEQFITTKGHVPLVTWYADQVSA